ncbi:proline iminopeptidase [Saprolegnia parasitica CBS 223.65]|uniref:Proline iminopeptidase n=1 Tax=Saprolegnia parasitica (strain CBS 223.65) TaxID=695850 RepID=A0A067CY03_SAPPC|nr:proline iminopeptidase [Saprolegnia parasitica CBS 223.65]KDO31662.1 proline iminopeptidase [Saprolegnia parasitica CBS 223.65]|eukprot:XP_012197550.1 proline iminopeptidase [Saprolegnia parasitica CBS 223.65]
MQRLTRSALALGKAQLRSSSALVATVRQATAMPQGQARAGALLALAGSVALFTTAASEASKWDLPDKSQCTAEDFLYPAIKPYKTGRLQVSPTHSIYYEECGNPKGKPVVLVHGGPGGGCTPTMNRYHDPKVYRIIAFDQRGSGRSTPHASLEDNTTWHLIADMEKLREELKIEKWQVFGGSWGSTLSTAYAEMHPTRVTELVLRGIFHIRDKEIQFYYQSGASFIYPDRWEAYRDAIPEDERHDFLSAYHRRLTSPDEKVRLAAALAWTTWEMSTSNLKPPTDAVDKSMANARFAEAFARIENHYFVNKGFLPTPNFLIDNVYKIRHIPTVIVQGRYDVVCPMETAWEFHKAFPEAEFHIVQTAGHSAGEPGIVAELVKATNKFKP